MNRDLKIGALFAIGAYASWGFFPLYWKLLPHVPQNEILAFRGLFAFFFFLLLTHLYGQWDGFKNAFKSRRELFFLLLSGVNVFANWWLFIFAVMTGHILDASLGYFINPLMNVFLGFIFFKERLTSLQWVACALALCAVLNLIYSAGHFPWLALALAGTFAIYGALRKKIKTPSIAALGVEGVVHFFPLVALMIAGFFLNHSVFSHDAPTGHMHHWLTFLLLILGGVVTGLPLVFFGEAAKRLPLSTMGFFQYISPTLQFSLAVFVYQEPFDLQRGISFVMIWSALALYSYDIVKRSR